MIGRILESISRIILSFIFISIVFALYRLFFLMLHLPPNTDASVENYLFAFFTGWRFDTLVFAFTFLPVFALELVSSIFNLRSVLSKSIIWLSVFITILLAILLLIDVNYYSFFKSHIDSRVFGIVQDSTAAVLKSVYTDFPLIRILIGLVILTVGTYYVFRWIHKPDRTVGKVHPILGSLLILVFLAIYFFGMRGTLKDKVLNMEESYISTNPFINTLAVNGIYTFKESFRSLQYDYLFQDPEAFLEGRDLTQLVAIHTGLPSDSINSSNPLWSLNRTTGAKQTELPNIVFFQMEGLGSVAWTAQQEQFNIIGDLIEEMKYGYVFKNFMPCQNGTIVSLEGILLDTPLTPVGQSKVASKQFSSSVVLPFKQNGYATTFLTAGTTAWRNLNAFLPNQGFDKVEGSVDIIKHIPEAESFIWGVHDGYMFNYCWDMLNNGAGNTGKPQFIYAMTVTNHSPYDTPKGYKVDDLKPDKVKLRIPLLHTDGVLAYRYACDQLASFLKKLRNSDLSQNTIVVVTGDHCMHQEFDTPAHDLYYRLSVPLIMFIPERYLQGASIDTSQWASHKDIFPTLFNLALPQTTYLHLGRNLLEPENHQYSINEFRYLFNSNGGYDLVSGQKYKWQGDYMNMEPDSDTTQNNELKAAIRKAEATNILRQYIQLKNTTGK